MKNRLIIFVCILLMLTSFLAGCGGGSKSLLDPKKPASITVWTYYNGEQRKAFEKVVADFNNTIGQERGVYVESVSKADVETLNSQVLSAARGEPNASPLPNMFFTYVDVAYDLYQMDLLKSFNDYLSDEVMDSFVPGFLAEGRIAGNEDTYVLPVAKSSEVIAINKTFYDEFCRAVNADSRYNDVSMDNFKTWEGIVEAAEVYRQWIDDNNEQEVAESKALFGIDSVANLIYSTHRQLDLQLFTVKDRSAVVNLATGGIDRLWDIYFDPMINGGFAAFGRYRSDDLRTGGILAFLGSSTSASYINEEIVSANGRIVPIELDIMPMPVFADGRPVAIQQGAGMALIKSDEKHEAACALFAEWFTRPEQNICFARDSAYIPVTTRAINDLISQLRDKEDSNMVERMLLVSLEQISSGYEMYTPPFFTGSYDVRRTLGDTMTAKLEQAAGEAEYNPDLFKKQFVEECAAFLRARGIETIV